MAKEAEKDEKCEEHKQPLMYYCADCKQSICSDCAMFESQHKGHKFEHLAKVCDQHLNSIRAEESFIAEKLKHYFSLMEAMRMSIDKVQKAKDDKEEELMRMISLFKEKLELQLNDKLMILLSEKNSVSEEIEQLEMLEKVVDKEIEMGSKAGFIEKSKELIAAISEAKARPLISFNDLEVSAHFVYVYYVIGIVRSWCPSMLGECLSFQDLRPSARRTQRTSTPPRFVSTASRGVSRSTPTATANPAAPSSRSSSALRE
eukprot:TRINITY_DN5456_c0_g2_i3.p1 TRINITY_DN5456_c0_g2~~TRINITY_DN5456_c0_g2_i3.p1  ORF type:complete len:260 (+),score=67.68 TRINITY_DN5456_c0_g2_i3:175-954(+)